MVNSLALTKEQVQLHLRLYQARNLDGLGFRQGVRITEFSNDDTMADGDPAAVQAEFGLREIY